MNISSVAGISGVGSSVAYAASKGALNTMTLSLSRALAPLIRVNTVCPGYIDTPWFTKGRGEAGAKQVRDSVVARVPLKVASSAEDIAEVVCFLATPASSNMTGEIVRMDAGMHLISVRACHSGRARVNSVRNCAPENLEIPGLVQPSRLLPTWPLKLPNSVQTRVQWTIPE